MSSFQHDLVIKNPRGRPIAVIEVKNMQNLSRDEAIAIRHDLFDYGFTSQVPYFLLLSQEVGFMWKESKQKNPDAPPTYEFPMDKVITRYLRRNPGRRLYGEELEILLFRWLISLVTETQEDTEEPEKTLARSGFSELIRGAEVLLEEAV
jgi:hypothetical protein